MKHGLVIADSGVIFSLAAIQKLNLLEKVFDEIKVPRAVWVEITRNQNSLWYHDIYQFFHQRIADIQSPNDLILRMDYGESESVIL